MQYKPSYFSSIHWCSILLRVYVFMGMNLCIQGQSPDVDKDPLSDRAQELDRCYQVLKHHTVFPNTDDELELGRRFFELFPSDYPELHKMYGGEDMDGNTHQRVFKSSLWWYSNVLSCLYPAAPDHYYKKYIDIVTSYRLSGYEGHHASLRAQNKDDDHNDLEIIAWYLYGKLLYNTEKFMCVLTSYSDEEVLIFFEVLYCNVFPPQKYKRRHVYRRLRDQIVRVYPEVESKVALWELLNRYAALDQEVDLK